MAVGKLAQSDTDAILPVSLGTIAWAIVLVALLVARPALEERGTTWWIGAAVVGVVSGVGGIIFLRWRKGRMTARMGEAPGQE
jgi:hypothetical protein